MDVNLGLTGEDAVYQNIRTILFTEKGSVPLMPNFGLGSEMMKAKSDAELSAMIYDQLTTYEPRINIKRVFIDGESFSSRRVRLLYNIEGYDDEEFSFFEPL